MKLPEENPVFPEEINNPGTNPFSEFLVLLAAVGLLLAGTVIVISIAFEKVAHYIPYSWEPDIMGSFETDEEYAEVQKYLQKLAEEIAIDLDLPEEMKVNVHVIDGPPNAFATLGGNMMVTTGLLRVVQSENGLAMVVGHELMHLKNRDAIASFGSSILVSIAISSVFGSNSSASFLGNKGTVVTMMGFSRDMESEADAGASQGLLSRYGHTGGGTEFFDYIMSHHDEPEWELLFRTHPLSEDRVDAIQEASKFSSSTSLAPLPESVLAFQTEEPEKDKDHQDG
jgi:predicted Zn-dependent protease